MKNDIFAAKLTSNIATVLEQAVSVSQQKRDGFNTDINPEAKFDYWLDKAVQSEDKGGFGIDALCEYLLEKPERLDNVVESNPNFAKICLGKLLTVFAQNDWTHEDDKMGYLRRLSEVTMRHLPVFARIPDNDKLFAALVMASSSSLDKLSHIADSYLAAVTQADAAKRMVIPRLRHFFYASAEATSNSPASHNPYQKHVFDVARKEGRKEIGAAITGIHKILRDYSIDAWPLVPTDDQNREIRAREKMEQQGMQLIGKIAGTALGLRKDIWVREAACVNVMSDRGRKSTTLILMSAPEQYDGPVDGQNLFLLSRYFSGTAAQLLENIDTTPVSRLRKWQQQYSDVAAAFSYGVNNVRSQRGFDRYKTNENQRYVEEKINRAGASAYGGVRLGN